MIYTVKIEAIDAWDYEGTLIIVLNGKKHRVSYQAPSEFATRYLCINGEVQIDLWLVYGSVKKVEVQRYTLPADTKIVGGTISGKVIGVIPPWVLRVDCGLTIDVFNRIPIGEVRVGDYIETRGTYQVYFPNTEWSMEKIGPDY